MAAGCVRRDKALNCALPEMRFVSPATGSSHFGVWGRIPRCGPPFLSSSFMIPASRFSGHGQAERR